MGIVFEIIMIELNIFLIIQFNPLDLRT